MSSRRGGAVVRAEGTAEIDESAPPADEVQAYLQKYHTGIARIGFEVSGFARDYTLAVRVTPTRWQIW